MTVQSSVLRADYPGNDITDTFTVPFYFLADSHLLVLFTTVAGTQVGTLNSDYTVTGAGVSGGGEILTAAPIPTGMTVSILQNPPISQLTHYVEGDPFPAASHENALDLLTIIALMHDEQISRSLRAPRQSPNFDGTLPVLTPGELLGVNMTGTGFVGMAAPTGTAVDVLNTLASTAAGQGAARVGYLAPYTGAVATTQDQINLESVSIFRWFTAAQIADWRSGALAVDVTLAVQKALDNCPLSSILIFPPGKGRISDQGGAGYILRVSRPVRIMGSGAHYCALVPVSGTSATCDIIQIYPSISYACDLLTIDGVFIGNPDNGTCAGRHSIIAVMPVSTQYLPKFKLSNCSIGTSANGYSFKHLHANADPQGSLWTSVIENNQLRSGIWLEGSGDSNTIRNNTISGAGIGIYIQQITGASCLEIENNNITSALGAIKVDLASRISVRHNNIECAGAGSNGAVIDINGASGVSHGGSIRDNLVSGMTGCTLTTGLRIKNSYGLHIEDNVFLGVSAMNKGIDVVDASVHDLRIGANSYNAAITTKITDAGQGTMGVEKTLTLATTSPQWVNYNATYFNTPGYIKDCNGIVHLFGAIKDGLATGGTALFTLPIGARPKMALKVLAFSYGGAVAGVGGLTINSTASGAGECNLEVGGNTLFSLEGISFPAETLADAVALG